MAGAGVVAAVVPGSAAWAGKNRDLTGWASVVGDGVYAAPGQAPVDAADIAVDHLGGYSRLRANIRERGVMAHVIAYRRRTGAQQMRVVQRGAYAFRLPFVPSRSGGTLNAQTVEGGLFVWDGTLDHGTAFQWVLNPWSADFGRIQVWAGERWRAVGYRRPDTAWHRVVFEVDPAGRTSKLLLDGKRLPVSWSSTTKSGWDRAVAARLQVEAISLHPGENATRAPRHEVHVRDWSWTSGR